MYKKSGITDTEKPSVPKTKTAEQAVAALMRYAARAERSSGDAMRLMQRWGVPEADRGKVLDRLTAAGFIDDERFAAAYVREKSEFSGWGIYKIRAGLRNKGIARDTAERAIAALNASSCDEKLEEVMARKLKNIKADTPYDRKSKLIRFGLSRGYEYDAVMETAERLVKTADQ